MSKHDELRDKYQRILVEAEGPVSLVPNAGMRSAARRGLELYKQGRGGDGLVAGTIRDARKMAAGQALSESKVRRMRAWFARHYVDKKPGWSDPGKETPGYVAHLLWGGDSGRSWAEVKVRQLDNMEEKMRESDDYMETGDYSLRQIAMAEMYDEIAVSLGKWDKSHGPEGAHYLSAEDNPFAESEGGACVNCRAFRGGGYCDWVEGHVDPYAVCKLVMVAQSHGPEAHEDEESEEGGESPTKMSEAVYRRRVVDPEKRDDAERGEEFDPFSTRETE